MKILRFLLYFVLMVNPVLATDVICYALHPPEVTLHGIKRIIILDFATKDGGQNLTDFIREGLITDQRTVFLQKNGGLLDKLFGTEKNTLYSGRIGETGACVPIWAHTNVIDVVNRTRVKEILDEHKLAGTGYLTPSQVKQLGNWIGADAVIRGGITRIDDGKDRSTGSHSLPCRTRKAEIKVTMDILSINENADIATKVCERSCSVEKCGDEISSLPTRLSLLLECYRSASLELLNHVSPYFDRRVIPLQPITAPKLSARSQNAEKWVKFGDMQRAFKEYTSVLQDDRFNAEVPYNLGVLNEAVGNYELARQNYNKAIVLDPDQKLYRVALTRVARDVSCLPIWREYGMNVTEFQWEKQELLSTARLTVRTRGDHGDRLAVYEEPNIRSRVFAEVPGQMMFDQIGDSTEWIRIELPDSTSGWIRKADLQK